MKKKKIEDAALVTLVEELLKTHGVLSTLTICRETGWVVAQATMARILRTSNKFKYKVGKWGVFLWSLVKGEDKK